MKRKFEERVVDIVINVVLIILGLVALYPIWYVIIASISSPVAISTGEVVFLPKGLNIDAYKALLAEKRIWIGYRNSIVYTTAATILDLLVMIPCAYALSRHSLPGRKFFMTAFIFTMYFSGGLVPKYLVINSLGMVNTPWALIIPGCVNVFNMIIARSFFESSIPDSLLDAAQIDGANYTRFFVQIVLPLSPAMLAIIALYSVTAHWNAYLGAQMYIYDADLYTLQQVIKSITATLDSTLMENATFDEISAAIREKQLMKYAVVLVASLPLVVAYPFIQKYFVKGVMVGAVKG